MAHELRTRARSSGRAAVERRTAFIGPTPPASERVPPRMWCTVNHLGMMAYSGRWDAEVTRRSFAARGGGFFAGEGSAGPDQGFWPLNLCLRGSLDRGLTESARRV